MSTTAKADSGLAAALLPAAAAGTLVLALFAYWFVIADRYAVFLYGHLGATPFDAVTSSRYRMAGCIAAAIVLVLGVLARLSALLLRRQRTGGAAEPLWWQHWLWLALPVGAGIVGITTQANAPVLPWRLAAEVAAVALAALALALWAVSQFRRPGSAVWKLLGGLGILPVLQLMLALERTHVGWLTPGRAWLVAVASVGVSALCLAAHALAGRRLGFAAPRAREYLLMGCIWGYLLLPLAHYLFATPPGYRYITNASNFLADSWILRGATWIITALVASAAARLGSTGGRRATISAGARLSRLVSRTGLQRDTSARSRAGKGRWRQ